MSKAIKTKLSWPVSLSEAKRHLNKSEDERMDDDYIQNLIYSATEMAENYIGKDIAETNNVQELYDWTGIDLELPIGNFISLTSAVTDASVSLTVDKTEIYYNYVYFEFDTTYDADPLTLTYKTGYEEGECPFAIKQAILLKIGELFYVDRQGYTDTRYRNSDSFQRALNAYRKVNF